MAETQKKTTSRKAGTPETPEAKAEVRETQATVTRDTDRVAMVSRRADGTPDQSKGYEVLDKDGE